MTKCEPTGYTDTEVWWTCPKCGARNFGVYYSHARPCAECDYKHPPAGEVGCLGDDELLRDKEIREHKARIERLQAILDNLLGEVNELEEEIANEERELRALQPVSKSKMVEYRKED